jgi:hypothetical protein
MIQRNEKKFSENFFSKQKQKKNSKNKKIEENKIYF